VARWARAGHARGGARVGSGRGVWRGAGRAVGRGVACDSIAPDRRPRAVYINGYDHPSVISGAGTMGLEIVEQCPEVEAVVVPVGGGGLIAGTALAIKSLRPDVLVIGVEPRVVPSMKVALETGRPVAVKAGITLADGLMVPTVGTNAFELVRQHVDKVVLVDEIFVALSMLRLLEMDKSVVEGGGAAGVAAALQGLLPELQGKKVVFPLCGGNVDTVTLGRVIERGLAADGRLIRFTVDVSDRPGSIARLTRSIADHGVSIREIFHERAFLQADLTTVRITIIAETTGGHQAATMLNAIQDDPLFNLIQEESQFAPRVPAGADLSAATWTSPHYAARLGAAHAHALHARAASAPSQTVFVRSPDGKIRFSADIISSGESGAALSVLAAAIQAEELAPADFVQRVLRALGASLDDEITIDQAQLQTALRAALPDMAPEVMTDVATRVFSFFDVNVDGTISTRELIDGVHAIEKTNS
jgi:Pyridoxal-phosphate dependent enzyme/ACT domain